MITFRRPRRPLLVAVGTVALSIMVGAAVGGFAASLSVTSEKVTVFAPTQLPPANCTEGSDTVAASADSWVEEGAPAANYGTDANLYATSKASAQNRRTFLKFPLPTIPSGCEVTVATLFLYAKNAVGGRTIQAYRAGADWTETGITWDTQPATVDSATTAASASGWVDWSVTNQVKSMYTGGNYGFIIKDATESDGDNAQNYASREDTSSSSAYVPYLIVGWSDGSCTTGRTEAVVADADSTVDQSSPDSNVGTTADLVVLSKSGNANKRSVVHFALPALSSGCSVLDAEFRMNSKSGATGRTIQVYRVTASWTETGVTWNNQPTTTGTAASTASVGTGWIEWDLTSQTQSSYDSGNYGFLLRDATEDQDAQQQFSSREDVETLRPRLFVTQG